MPSLRSVIWILALTILGGIGTIGFTLFQKAMTTQYQLGRSTMEAELLKAAMDADRSSTKQREAIDTETRNLTDDALLRDMQRSGWLRD
jgi:hypothetical protein